MNSSSRCVWGVVMIVVLQFNLFSYPDSQPPKQSRLPWQQSIPREWATKKQQLVSFDTAEKLIDLIALGYASKKVYERYQLIGAPNPTPTGLLSSIIAKIYPVSLTCLEARSKFILDSSLIIIETLAYKTLAKLILLCGKGDLRDVAKQVATKTKNFLTSLLI